MSDFETFLASRARLDSLLGTPTEAMAQFIQPPTPSIAAPQLVNAGGDAIITNEGITVTNGAITVRNAGSVVVIDGTSNMFKIAASGTLSVAWPGSSPGANEAVVTLAGVAVASAPPAVVGLVSAYAGGQRAPIFMSFTAAGALMQGAFWWVKLVAGSTTDCEIHLYAQACTVTSTGSAGVRYYVLREAGL